MCFLKILKRVLVQKSLTSSDKNKKEIKKEASQNVKGKKNAEVKHCSNFNLQHLFQGFSQCKRYNYDLETCVPGQDLTSSCISPYPADDTVQAIKCDKGYWYDTSVYESTTVTEVREKKKSEHVLDVG